jgi:hypothetical protein
MSRVTTCTCTERQLHEVGCDCGFERDNTSIHAMRRFLSKNTPKGLLIKAISGGKPDVTYFIGVRGRQPDVEFAGPLKFFPSFEPVTDEAEAGVIYHFARKALCDWR